VAGADSNFERFSWPDGGDATLSQHASVKEGIAGPVRKFYETKSFLWAEPFDEKSLAASAAGVQFAVIATPKFA
jgi:hypothetical protein